MAVTLQLLISALSMGSFYALVAMGFSLIFGVTHAFNLAHGEMVLLGGYLAYSLWKHLQFPFWTTLPLSMAALLVAASLLHVLLRRVREPFEVNTLVITFGLALLAQNVLLFVFSADYRMVPSEEVYWVGSGQYRLAVTANQVALMALSLGATGLVHTLLRRTFLGKALRATIQDREAAQLAGIHVRHMSWLAFALGGGLIGLAGPLWVRTIYLQPAGGIEATLVAVTITIFAGMGRTRSVLLGGWLLAAAEALAAYGLGASWRELVSALLLICLLVLRPSGIFPQGAR
jgi:branched-chain amino acid transport system permease protein